MTEYSIAKNFVTALKKFKNINNELKTDDIKTFKYGFLAGVQKDDLPNGKIIKNILFNDDSKDHELIEILKREHIIK